MKAIFKWYIRGSLHVSLALISLVAYSGLVMDVPVSIHYFLALFFGSIAGYNGIKYGLEPAKHRFRVPGGLRYLAVFSLGCLVYAVYHLSYLPPVVWILLMVCGGITAVYAIPLMPGQRNLRSFGLVKVLMVSLVWTTTSLWIPVWGYFEAISWDLYVESLQRLLWVFLLMLPFEIRDMHRDPPSLRTIPQRYGIKGTRRIAWFGVILFVGGTLLKDLPTQGELASKVITGLLMGLATSRAPVSDKGYFSSFWVEGIPVVSVVLLWAFGG